MPYERSEEDEEDEDEPEDALPCLGFGPELEGIIVRMPLRGCSGMPGQTERRVWREHR